MKLCRIVTLVIIAAAFAAGIWVYLQQSSQPPAGRMTAGASAPAFETVTLQGENVSLSEYKGRVVLLNFWATWCKPCMREMPLLNVLSESAELPVETLFVNAGESKGTVSEYMAEHQFSFPVIIDVTGRISASYRVNALPSTYIINKTGKISRVVVGEIGDLDTLKQWLAEAGAD
ncbi:redoxin domain-containing protein [Paenibacillus sp. FSL P4-0338]|uniref:TlpA family protein disulfide reductase n=1 Tax=unclassified Paenibacillus TaxID=185978 RepID=UPI0003E20CA4|nr:redoxin domain-containing protein [Paenibacillus sp. FSL R7-269]ETT56187.1 thiol-disulfide oxidoreductase [Paenibacillus sp. FSL R7-269]